MITATPVDTRLRPSPTFPHRYNTLGALLPHISKVGVDLLNEMLTYDPDKRLSAR